MCAFLVEHEHNKVLFDAITGVIGLAQNGAANMWGAGLINDEDYDVARELIEDARRAIVDK